MPPALAEASRPTHACAAFPETNREYIARYAEFSSRYARFVSGNTVRPLRHHRERTPLEPEWEGHVTLEFSNTTPLPAKIYANEGVAQMLFFESDEVCATSYADRGGKYQGQQGVTLPKA